MRWMGVLLLLAGIARAEDPGFGTPIVALTLARGVDFSERHARATVVLYADGHIARSDGPSNTSYEIGSLSSDALRALLAELPLDRIGSLHPEAELGNDGWTSCIVVWRKSERRRDCYWPSLGSSASERPYGPGPPAEMVEIWRRLITFEIGIPVAWVPKNIAVRLGPPRKNCPALDWPDLASRVRGHEDKRFEVDRALAGRLLEIPLSFSPSCYPQVLLDGATYSVQSAPVTLSLPPR